MALIKCEKCQHEISPDASTCPSCGAKRPRHLKATEIVLGLIMALGLFAWLSKSEKPAIAPESAIAAPTAITGQAASASREVIDIAAADLFKDYEKNEVAADNKLKGKLVRVSGKVSAIDKDITDSAVINLASGNQFSPVRLSLKDSDKNKAATLSKGDKVIITCEKMTRIIGSPMGSDCVLSPSPPQPQPAKK